ncbi:MAG: 50S ribosomal protein L9 [Planctomycetota bacterium]|jgi:large subunit ribosomal protein L9
MPRHRRTLSILLLEDSEHLGHVGDIVEVKPGYARNFLFPNGTACPVTQEAMRHVERAKERAVETRRKHAAQLADQAEQLEGLSITLEQRASEEGHLFGSVGTGTIVETLAEKGISVEEKQVGLEHPIKELGIYNVPIILGKKTSAEIRVWVVEPSE